MSKIYLDTLNISAGKCSFVVVISNHGNMTRIDGSYKIGSKTVLVSRSYCGKGKDIYPTSRGFKLIPTSAIRKIISKKCNKEPLSRSFFEISPWF